MEDYIEVITLKELPDGTMRRIEVAGEHILLARVGDEVFAVQSRCPHVGADLSRGRLEGTVVRCPLHGSRFDLSDGSVVQWTAFPPSVRAVSDAVRPPRPLRVFEVRVVEGGVFVGPQRGSGPST